MSSQHVYGIQSSSRRILFSDDDVKGLIASLASARLTSAEQDTSAGGALAYTEDSYNEEEEEDFLFNRKFERKPLRSLRVENNQSPKSQAVTSSVTPTLFTGVERKFLLGGSAKRVEREETPKSSGFKLKLAPGSTHGVSLFALNQAPQTIKGHVLTEHNTNIAQPIKRLIKSDLSRSISADEDARGTPSSQNRQFETPRSSAKLDSKKNRVGWSPNPPVNEFASDPSPNTLQEVPDTHAEELEYEYLKVLGKGSFGKVLFAQHKPSKHVVAIKILDRKKLLERGNLRRAHMEIRCLEKCAGPFIVGLLSAFETKSRLFIVQEICAGGELFSLLARKGKLPSHMARFYTAQCAMALHHLHSRRFAYRDLKTENIMLDRKGNVRLVDFGLVKEGISQPERGSRSFVGTTEYIAPEMLLRAHVHGFAVDWWALGIVIHELLTGLPPWYANNASEMHRRVMHDPLVMTSPYLSEEARVTIAAFLEKQPMKRLGSFGGIDAVQKSPFFQSLNWEDLAKEELDPPFVPALENEQDLSYFSDEFLSLPLELSAD